MNIKNKNLFLSFNLMMLMILASCGDSSTASQTVVETDDQIDQSFSFDASLNQVDSKYLTITNRYSESISISQVILNNNVCGAFSIDHVINSQRTVIDQASGGVSFELAPNQSVFMKVDFSPVYCPQFTDYYTDVIVVKNINGVADAQTYKLHVQGISESTPVEITTCESNNQDDEYLPLIKSGVPCEGQYYLKVTGMQAMIYVIKAADNSAVISTSSTPTYEPAYLPVTVGPTREVQIEGEPLPRQVADFTIPEVTECDDFRVPSKKDDAFFGGSDTLIMTKGEATGQLEFISDFQNLVRKTVMNLEQLKIKLKATGLETLIADEGGNFQISLNTPLTTELSDSSPYLGIPYEDVVAAQGLDLDFLNVIPNPTRDFSLQGIFSDQGIKMVGIGDFNNDDEDFLGDAGTAKNFLIDNPALLAIELDMEWTYRAGDEFPEGCGTL